MKKQASTSSHTENDDLNLHVELCSERYKRLEEKFSTLEDRLDDLSDNFNDFKKSADKNFSDLKDIVSSAKNKNFNVVLTTAGTIIVALLSVMGYLIVNMK